jgi:hypothetical protein
MPDSPNPSPTQEVERYEPVVHPVNPAVGEPYPVPGLRPCESGEAVLFVDHQRLLQAEVEKREEVEEEARDLGARLLVAASKHRAAESKLSSVVEELEHLAEVERDERGELWRVGDAFSRAAQLLRDKGTEQGEAVSQFCGTEHHVLCPGCPCSCHKPSDDKGGGADDRERLESRTPRTDVAGAGVAIEGDPGLEEGGVEEAVDRFRRALEEVATGRGTGATAVGNLALCRQIAEEALVDVLGPRPDSKGGSE